MIEAIEDNKVSAVFVKDLSRLGRNYIEVGKLTEKFLPEYDIRLVAVSDNIDTAEDENELAPRMLNELIKKIEVYQSEKIDGKTVQQLTIHYNCICNIEIPDPEKLPENNVSISTRQGIDVHFAACAS